MYYGNQGVVEATDLSSGAMGSPTLVSETFHKFRAETRAAQSRKLDEPINKL
jgi:hypothetical protein